MRSASKVAFVDYSSIDHLKNEITEISRELKNHRMRNGQPTTSGRNSSEVLMLTEQLQRAQVQIEEQQNLIDKLKQELYDSVYSQKLDQFQRDKQHAYCEPEFQRILEEARAQNREQQALIQSLQQKVELQKSDFHYLEQFTNAKHDLVGLKGQLQAR